MGKVWRNGGEEDKYIRRLIRIGKINKFTKPTDVKKLNPSMFNEFNANVIRNHLNALKMSCGLFIDEGSDYDIDVVDENPEQKVTADEPSTPKSLDEPTVGYVGINFRNFPVVCEPFKDPVNSSDKVALIVSLPAGAQNVTIELSDNGWSVCIKYNWPKTMYDMHELFGKMVAQGVITNHHPRILSIKHGLEKSRKHVDDVPDASMTVTLPIQVQTGGDSWSMGGVKRNDGTQILTAEFTGYVKDYNCKVRGVKFE